MFGLFKKDRRKVLEKQYADKLREARDAQRSGDLRLYAQLLGESEQIVKEIEALPNGKLPMMLL